MRVDPAEEKERRQLARVSHTLPVPAPPPPPRWAATMTNGSTSQSTLVGGGIKQPSRSPSDLFGPKPTDGSLTPQVLRILERTSATLEHLNLQRISTLQQESDGGGTTDPCCSNCCRSMSATSGPSCASSCAVARSGVRRERYGTDSPRQQKSRQWAHAAAARMSPERKLERYLQVHCSGAAGPTTSLAATSSSSQPESSSPTALVCASPPYDADEEDMHAHARARGRRTHGSPHVHAHLGKIPSGLCNGTAVAVLSAETLQGLKAERAERNASRRAAAAADLAAANEAKVASWLQFSDRTGQWSQSTSIHADVLQRELQLQLDARIVRAKDEFERAGVLCLDTWARLWKRATRWYWESV